MDRADEKTARAEPFGYVCGRCGACCRHDLVALTAYDAQRLARRLGLGPDDFRARYTRRGLGGELAHQADGACVFLGESGCRVYEDRPLVCRLYPLRRTRGPDGGEVWRHAPPKPGALGDDRVTGTIADFLRAQDAEAHIAAADAESGRR